MTATRAVLSRCSINVGWKKEYVDSTCLVRGSSLESMPSAIFNQGQIFRVVFFYWQKCWLLSGLHCPLPQPPLVSMYSQSRKPARMAGSMDCLGYALRGSPPSEVVQYISSEAMVLGSSWATDIWRTLSPSPYQPPDLLTRQLCHPLLWASELWFANQFLRNFTIKHIELLYVKDRVSCISSKTLFNNISLIHKCAKIL